MKDLNRRENSELVQCSKRDLFEKNMRNHLNNSGVACPYLHIKNKLVTIPVLDNIPAIVDFYNRNKEHLSEFAAKIKSEILKEDYWKNRIEQMHKSYNNDSACNLFIMQESEIVGFINFFNPIRGAFHCCTLGYGLDKDQLGQGIMSAALKEAIQFMFGNLNFHRIEANHHPDNIKSANVLRGLGFASEGLANDYLWVNGAWVPHMRTSLTNQHWIEPSN